MSSGRLTTPTCEVTQLPLPILPTLTGNEDFHHHFHPAKSPELGALTSLSGRALRYSRGQDVNRTLHNRYHNIFTGPDIPQTDDERLRLCLLACAGVVPRQALDLSTKGQFEIVDVDDETYRELTRPQSIHVEKQFHQFMGARKRQAIGEYFAAQALQLQIDDIVSRKVIKEFLGSKTKPERRMELGNFILKEASIELVRPLAPLYEDLKTEGYVGNRKVTSISKAVLTFFTKDFYPQFYKQAEDRLAQVA